MKCSPQESIVVVMLGPGENIDKIPKLSGHVAICRQGYSFQGMICCRHCDDMKIGGP